MSEPPQDGAQKGGVVWQAGVEQGVWAFHLTQDILHDDLGDTQYAMAPPPLPVGARGGEGGTYDFLVGKASEQDPNFGARQSKILQFSINKGTETFQQWNAPILYGANNASVGIVQDAGKFITKLLGAQNVITFGHVLDPAGTTVDPKTDPILYIPPAGQNTVTIDLGQFGFNPAIISSIDVNDFTAGTVKCVWNYKGVPTDAISTQRVVAGTPLVAKQLNNPRTEKAGFFVSRVDAMGRGNLARGVDLLPYKIGKTLGDTLLVASAMPSFAGPVANRYYGPIGAADRWQRFGPAPPGAGDIVVPRVLMLKTGDKLNHLRAVLKDVPSILEKPAAGGKGRMFEFFPGVVSDADIIAALQSALTGLPGIVKGRYDTLVASFRTLSPLGGVFNAARAKFTTGDPSIDAKSTRSAGIVIDKICEQLEFVRDHIAGIFTTLSQPPAGTALNFYKRLYETANELANRLSPPTSSIFTERGLLKQKIVVICAPSGGYKAPLGYIQPIVIELHPLCMMLKRNKTDDVLAGGGGWEALYPRINGSSFDTNFFRRAQAIVPLNPATAANGILAGIPIMPGGARIPKVVARKTPTKSRIGSIFSQKAEEELKIDVPLVPTVDYDRDAFDEFITDLTRGYVPGPIGPPPAVHPVPGINTAIYSERIHERAPLLEEFAAFVRESLRIDAITSGQIVAIVEELNRMRYELPVYSTSVLDELVDEVNGLAQYSLLPPLQVPPLPLPVAPVPIVAANPFTILYNAFTFRKNADYASDPGLTGAPLLDDLGFTKYSARLIRSLRPAQVIELTPDSSGTAVIRPSAARELDRTGRITLGGSAGGLRPRRPLYPNEQGTDSPRIHTDDDSGLRKRTRTRRTRRLRKSTRKSKTR